MAILEATPQFPGWFALYVEEAYTGGPCPMPRKWTSSNLHASRLRALAYCIRDNMVHGTLHVVHWDGDKAITIERIDPAEYAKEPT